VLRRHLIITLALVVLACRKNPAVQPFDALSMLDSVNAWRARGCLCGADTMPPVPLLSWNDTLATAARAHASDMYDNDYFSHIAPDGSSPIQRAMRAGYAGDYVGENIAEGYTSLAAVMQAWMASEDHCKNIMDSSWSSLGAATAGTYWDQEFGGY
jgi:uncharacterized protein YkwD